MLQVLWLSPEWVFKMRDDDGGQMKDRRACSIELESGKVEFLEQMAASYRLPDIGKAVRCLINYAPENPDKHEAIFAEVRCLDC
jgi:hypothetical protein